MVTYYCQYPLLINKYAVNDDVRQNTYIYLRYQDSELFQADYITDAYIKWQSLGPDFFYFITTKFFELTTITKILPFFLCSLIALFMFKIGELIGNNLSGLLAGFLSVLVIYGADEGIFFAAGAARDFAAVFFVIFIYYFLKNNWLGIFVSLLLQAIFLYPPTLFVCLSAFAAYILFNKTCPHDVRKKEVLYFIFISLIIFWGVLLSADRTGFSLVNLRDIRHMPEFFSGGRKVLFFSSFWQQLTNSETGFSLVFSMKYLILTNLILLLILGKKFRVFSDKLLYIILCSFIFFIIAYGVIYRLYGPARYIRMSLPIILVIFISLNIKELLGRLKSKYLRILLLFIFMVYTLVIFFPRLKSDYSIAPYPRLYSFLQTLPKNVLIAGHPSNMDFVPLFAKRKVLINEETSQPMYANFYPEIKKRTYDFFKVYYSESAIEIYNFCRKYNIEYFIVEKKHFSKDYFSKGEFYLSPFNEYIHDLLKRRNKFALLCIPKSEIVFEDDSVYVFRINDTKFWLRN